MAHKAQRNSQRRAAANAYITLLAENARNADNRVCHDVIEQNRADESRRRHAPAEDAVHRDAERKLNDGFHKGSRKAPLKAVHDGNHGAGQHGKHRDGTAKRHLKHLDHAEHSAQCDHNRAGRKLFCIVVLHSSFLRFSTEI